MYKIVLIRHGESTWNLENRFTGWTDVDLTPTGVSQAMSAGQLLKAEGWDFDVCFTSVLNKADMAKKFGEDQVLAWRRSYDTPPPALEASDPRCERGDRRYAHVEPHKLPLTECLKDTVARVLPCWNDTIAPRIRNGERILIAAHGNSIRALIKYLDNVSEQDIVGLNIPNGIPLVYELDAELKPIGHYYLGDAQAAAHAAAAVASQAKG